MRSEDSEETEDSEDAEDSEDSEEEADADDCSAFFTLPVAVVPVPLAAPLPDLIAPVLFFPVAMCAVVPVSVAPEFEIALNDADADERFASVSRCAASSAVMELTDEETEDDCADIEQHRSDGAADEADNAASTEGCCWDDVDETEEAKIFLICEDIASADDAMLCADDAAIFKFPFSIFNFSAPVPVSLPVLVSTPPLAICARSAMCDVASIAHATIVISAKTCSRRGFV